MNLLYIVNFLPLVYMGNKAIKKRSLDDNSRYFLLTTYNIILRRIGILCFLVSYLSSISFSFYGPGDIVSAGLTFNYSISDIPFINYKDFLVFHYTGYSSTTLRFTFFCIILICIIVYLDFLYYKLNIKS